jgi:hypothetical protein
LIRKLLLAASLATAVLLCGSCNELNPPKPRPRAIVWKSLGTWSGHGSTQTDSFDINIFRWRVHWKTANETAPGKGHFVLTVHSAISGRPLTELVNHDGPGEGYPEVNDDPRLYHMVIDSHDIDWTVTVEVPIATGGPE